MWKQWDIVVLLQSCRLRARAEKIFPFGFSASLWTAPSHLVENFLQVRCSHTVGQVSVCRMWQEELPLSSHSSSDVFPPINVFLTAVHHPDVAWWSHRNTTIVLTFSHIVTERLGKNVHRMTNTHCHTPTHPPTHISWCI